MRDVKTVRRSKVDVKSKEKTAAKGFQIVEKELRKKSPVIKQFTRGLKPADLKENETAVAYVSAKTESPALPATDEVREYIKLNGRMFYRIFDTEVI